MSGLEVSGLEVSGLALFGLDVSGLGSLTVFISDIIALPKVSREVEIAAKVASILGIVDFTAFAKLFTTLESSTVEL